MELEVIEEQSAVNNPTKYRNILQGKATNTLSKVSKKGMRYDDKVDSSYIDLDNVSIMFNDSSELSLNVQTHKVLDALILKLTSNFSMGENISAETIDRCRTVILTLDEYIEMCRLKARKKARKQLKDALQAIYNISLRWRETSYSGNKKFEVNWQARIADVMGADWFDDPIKNSKVIFKFTFDLAKYLSQAYIMPYPENLLQVNSRYNPHAYYLGRKLLDHYNQNFKKENRNKVHVSTLLRGLPDLPDYKNTEHVTQLIIDPFERDLDSLVNKYGILDSWEYRSKTGESVTEEFLKDIEYDVWTNLIILFEPKNYPQRQLRGDVKSQGKK